ncbi:MAG: response regulator [Planctomycetes bacterium]|nr:response regulator [Planctomycetota bacterium]
MLHPTILIADDDRRLRESLSEVFNDLGCTTRTAGNGGDAMEVLRQMRCDLLLSDVDMPDMTGFALLSWISHQTPRAGSHLPVILMSARADAELGRAARAAGAIDLLSKPVEITRITGLVHRLLEL